LNSRFRSKATSAPFVFAVMCVLVLSSCGNSSNSSTTTAPTPAANNSVIVKAGFGPLGSTGGFFNGLFTTITVCQHGTQTCVPITNVLVDTGSIGLRILGSAMGSVALSAIAVNGSPLQECVQFGDTSYAWGPMAVADVDIGGETAPDIPVQLLQNNGFTVPSSCFFTSPLPGEGNDDTLQSLGANGILGVGNGAVDGPWDFGSYYTCPGGACSGPLEVSTSVQDVNPVAMFTSTDRNGVMIMLPTVGATGAADATVSGTMTFGIATQADNALNSATVYAMDACDDFPQVNFGGLAYQDTLCASTGSGMGGFMDTGSNALFVSDAATLGPPISDCAMGTNGDGFYCVTGGGTDTLSSIQLITNSGASTLLSLNIADGTTLINTNNAVFNDLGGDSGTGPSTDFFDFGLPFFLRGTPVFIGITAPCINPGQCTTTGSFATAAPFGFVAF